MIINSRRRQETLSHASRQTRLDPYISNFKMAPRSNYFRLARSSSEAQQHRKEFLGRFSAFLLVASLLHFFNFIFARSHLLLSALYASVAGLPPHIRHSHASIDLRLLEEARFFFVDTGIGLIPIWLPLVIVHYGGPYGSVGRIFKCKPVG